jgi:hypothetical protein
VEQITLNPDIVILRGGGERTVLVRGDGSVTAIDLPADPALLDEVLRAASAMAPEGLKTAILTSEPEEADLNAERLAGVKVVRADRLPDLETEWDCVPEDLLSVPGMKVHLVRGRMTLSDGGGHEFDIEPCLGTPKALAVTILPEQIMVICDDLHAEMPPRIKPGAVHETMMRLSDWRLRAPKAIIPACGTPITGEQVTAALDRGIHYFRNLYQLTRTGLMESRLPWERLMYTIPYATVWDTGAADRAVVERHQTNVRHMAEDIWKRVQAEAEGTSLIAS